jgi:riboflavin transporter FmnP
MSIDYDAPPPSEPGRRKRVWPQVVFVFLLAAFAQVLGLVYAYVTRCKPGQGNDFCGASSLAGVLMGFVAAIMVLVAGLVAVFLRRKKTAGESGPGAGRIVAAVFGAILVVPCAWMIVGGWPRNNADAILWIGIVAGVGMIVAAFLRRRGA